MNFNRKSQGQGQNEKLQLKGSHQGIESVPNNMTKFKV